MTVLSWGEAKGSSLFRSRSVVRCCGPAFPEDPSRLLPNMGYECFPGEPRLCQIVL